MTPLTKKTAGTTIAALSLLGTLAGCASTATSDTGATTGTTTGTTTTTTAPSSGTSSTAATAASYKDGTYTAGGTYTSPNGREQISVKITLASGVINAVEVTGTPSGPDATNYQGQFEANIASVVVGKKIDAIKVDKVAGSSLTSGGFNAAISEIKAEALA